METTYEEIARQLLQEAEDDHFEFEAYLIWPSGYDVDAYLKRNETSVLRAIAESFRCRIQHEKTTALRYTRIQAEVEPNLLAVYQRLIGLAKEMVSEKQRAFRVNLFLRPSSGTCKEKIELTQDAMTRHHKIAMTGYPISRSITQAWDAKAKSTERESRLALRNEIQSFVHNFHASRKFVRLRLEFGDLDLVKFPAPSPGQRSYAINNFLEILCNPRVQLSDCRLTATKQDLSSLFDVLKATEELTFLEESFEVHYDFQKPDNGDKIRLQTEMVRFSDKGEGEARAQRWLAMPSTKDQHTLLSVKILDLVNPSFQVRAEGFDVLTEDMILKEMGAFERQQSYEPGEANLAMPPCRRTTIPNTAMRQDLVSVTEISGAKFRLQNTDSTLELRRLDVFDQRFMRSSNESVSSTWVVSYYYAGWDDLMNDFANIGPGDDVPWERDISTFFPRKVNDLNPCLLPQGYKNLWTEAKQIQDLLKRALSRLPKVETGNIQNHSLI